MSSEIKRTVIETFEDLYKAGGVNEVTIRQMRALCLPQPQEYNSTKIIRVRKKYRLSQAAFAVILNTSASTVQKWERGVKNPSGPAIKLLHLMDVKGINAVL